MYHVITFHNLNSRDTFADEFLIFYHPFNKMCLSYILHHKSAINLKGMRFTFEKV